MFPPFTYSLILLAFIGEFFLKALTLQDPLVNSPDFYHNKENWVDPGNMFDYDYQQHFAKDFKNYGTSEHKNSKGNENKSSKRSSLSEEDFCDCLEMKRKLQIQQNYLKNSIQLLLSTKEKNEPKIPLQAPQREDKNSTPKNFTNWHHMNSLIKKHCRPTKQHSDRILLNRIIGHVLKTFKAWDAKTLTFSVTLSKDEQKLLQEVLDNNRNVATVDDILLDALFSEPGPFVSMSMTVYQTVTEFAFQYKEVLFVGFLIILMIKLEILSILIVFVKYRFFLALFIVATFISVCTEWMHLYQKEVAKQHVTMVQFKSMEDACKEEYTWFWSIFFLKSGKCKDYVEAVHIDPFWKVTILQAMSGAGSKMLFQPISHFGTALTQFINIIGKDLPWYQSQPVIYLVIIFILFLIYTVISYIFGIGFRVRIPGVTIETTKRETQPLPSSSSQCLIGQQVDNSQFKIQESIDMNPNFSSSQSNQLVEKQNQSTDDKILGNQDKKIILVNFETVNVNASSEASNSKKESVDEVTINETNETLLGEMNNLSSVVEKLRDLSIGTFRSSAVRDHQSEGSARYQNMLTDKPETLRSDDDEKLVSEEEECDFEECLSTVLNNIHKIPNIDVAFEKEHLSLEFHKSIPELSTSNANLPIKDDKGFLIENISTPPVQDHNISTSSDTKLLKSNETINLSSTVRSSVEMTCSEVQSEIKPIISSLMSELEKRHDKSPIISKSSAEDFEAVKKDIR